MFELASRRGVSLWGMTIEVPKAPRSFKIWVYRTRSRTHGRTHGHTISSSARSSTPIAENELLAYMPWLADCAFAACHGSADEEGDEEGDRNGHRNGDGDGWVQCTAQWSKNKLYVALMVPTSP